MWPGNLKSIDLVGGLTFTEFWVLKERIDSGGAKIIDGPEKVFGKRGIYYTIYACGEQAYTLCTHGNPTNNSEQCIVTRVNKISIDRVYEIKSWQYE